MNDKVLSKRMLEYIWSVAYEHSDADSRVKMAPMQEILEETLIKKLNGKYEAWRLHPTLGGAVRGGLKENLPVLSVIPGEDAFKVKFFEAKRRNTFKERKEMKLSKFIAKYYLRPTMKDTDFIEQLTSAVANRVAETFFNQEDFVVYDEMIRFYADATACSSCMTKEDEDYDMRRYALAYFYDINTPEILGIKHTKTIGVCDERVISRALLYAVDLDVAFNDVEREYKQMIKEKVPASTNGRYYVLDRTYINENILGRTSDLYEQIKRKFQQKVELPDAQVFTYYVLSHEDEKIVIIDTLIEGRGFNVEYANAHWATMPLNIATRMPYQDNFKGLMVDEGLLNYDGAKYRLVTHTGNRYVEATFSDYEVSSALINRGTGINVARRNLAGEVEAATIGTMFLHSPSAKNPAWVYLNENQDEAFAVIDDESKRVVYTSDIDGYAASYENESAALGSEKCVFTKIVDMLKYRHAGEPVFSVINKHSPSRLHVHERYPRAENYLHIYEESEYKLDREDMVYCVDIGEDRHIDETLYVESTDEYVCADNDNVSYCEDTQRYEWVDDLVYCTDGYDHHRDNAHFSDWLDDYVYVDDAIQITRGNGDIDYVDENCNDEVVERYWGNGYILRDEARLLYEEYYESDCYELVRNTTELVYYAYNPDGSLEKLGYVVVVQGDEAAVAEYLVDKGHTVSGYERLDSADADADAGEEAESENKMSINDVVELL